MCDHCTVLMHEALNLTVRGRTLDAIQRREDTLDASVDREAWLASGSFDRHVARNNATCQPWNVIETRSLTPQLWAEDVFHKDLHDWEARCRKHMQEVHHAPLPPAPAPQDGGQA